MPGSIRAGFRRHLGVLGRGAGCLSLKMFKAQNCSSSTLSLYDTRFISLRTGAQFLMQINQELGAFQDLLSHPVPN